MLVLLRAAGSCALLFEEGSDVSTTAREVNVAIAADLDNDGFIDVVSASSSDSDTFHIVWYQNLDGSGNFGEALEVGPTTSIALSLLAVDIDADGHLDVLYTSSDADEDGISWFKNDGDAGFSPAVMIEARSSSRVLTGDLDSDGDLDLIVVPLLSSGLWWHKNTGDGTFEPSTSFPEPTGGWPPFTYSAEVGDIDGDGALDVACSFHESDGFPDVVWYQNDGLGSFAAAQEITMDFYIFLYGISSLAIADFDGDGDSDVAVAAGQMCEVHWYENQQPGVTFGPGVEVFAAFQVFGCTIIAADFDGDNDTDILIHSGARFETMYVNLAENTNGWGDFATTTVLAAPSISSVFAADFNGDGLMDVLESNSADHRITWHRSISSATPAPSLVSATPSPTTPVATSDIADLPSSTMPQATPAPGLPAAPVSLPPAGVVSPSLPPLR